MAATDDLDAAGRDRLARKKAKGERYAAEPERLTVEAAQFGMRTEHGQRRLVFADGAWRCSCDFFRDVGTCSHVIAVRRILHSAHLAAHERIAEDDD